MLLTTIFYHVDNFCKDLEDFLRTKKIGEKATIAGRKPCLTMSEIMTITIFFHHSRMRTFKDYYKIMIKGLFKDAFSRIVSYNRFVELMQEITMPLYLFLTCFRMGVITGISFVDSMKLAVCHNLRISSNKVFKGTANRGKSSTGWFYGFKLHLVINEYGEILAFNITSGNVDDRNEKVMKKLTKTLWGKLFGDRGYLSKDLTKWLQTKGIHLFTRIKKNMKNVLLTLQDKILLNKRGVIESVNNKLQEACQIEHTRHRSPINFLVNVLGALTAYTFIEKKPSIVTKVKSRLASVS